MTDITTSLDNPQPAGNHGKADPKFAAIHATLRRCLAKPGLRLRFSASLEQRYRQDRRREGLRIAGALYPYILALVATFGIVLFLGLPGDRQTSWGLAYLLLATLVAVQTLSVRIPRFDPWFDTYFSVLNGLGMGMAIVLPTLTDNPEARSFTFLGVYIAAATIGAVSIHLVRLPLNLASLWLGGGFGLLLLAAWGRLPSWLEIHQHYTLGCIVGSLFSVHGEHRIRLGFLQRNMLQLEMERSQHLASRMSQLSRRDALTGLANRRYFDEILEREWLRCRREQTPLGLLFVDVDWFKKYNDELGHHAGDECLQQLAKVIAGHCRRPADLAARYGGEEFVLLYPQTPAEAIHILGRRLCGAIMALALPHGGSEWGRVTVSIGCISVVPNDRLTAEELMLGADRALYQAKARGRNCAVLEYLPSSSDYPAETAGDQQNTTEGFPQTITE